MTLSWTIYPADCDDVIKREREAISNERAIQLYQSNIILDLYAEMDVDAQVLENERAYNANEIATLSLKIKEERVKKARSILIAGTAGAGIMAVLIGIGKYLLR